MNIPTAVNVPATTATTTTSTTTTTTTTTTADQMQTIPLKFSLMGLPGDIDNIRDFKNLMLKKVKAALANVAYDIGMKVTDVKEVYDLSLTAGRGLQSEADTFASKQKQTLHLLYDVEVLKDNPSKSYGTVLIETIRQRHGQILEDFQEYNNAKGYYYMSNFDLCTRSSGICALDHKTVTVKFSSADLNPTLNRDQFDRELLKIYSRILNDIDGLDLRDITLDRVVENSYGTDVYFNVDVISNGVDWKDVIETELEKEASRQVIINEVSKYTIQTLEEKGKFT